MSNSFFTYFSIPSKGIIEIRYSVFHSRSQSPLWECKNWIPNKAYPVFCWRTSIYDLWL